MYICWWEAPWRCGATRGKRRTTALVVTGLSREVEDAFTRLTWGAQASCRALPRLLSARTTEASTPVHAAGEKVDTPPALLDLIEACSTAPS